METDYLSTAGNISVISMLENCWRITKKELRTKFEGYFSDLESKPG